ncbi:histidinol-phosphate transaminase [uncultured Campylobacter sp.]|uniref:histidinol-phosphate transaminase n=1 Tax=uncultured Campylobacter sp. TaxID=218934 RepID=UPI0026112CFB|nr:histidinol-phosphate transaminase [uncultured Campylobacter sp.]
MEFNAYLDGLPIYEPGKDIDAVAREYGVKDVIKLASNENALGTSAKVIEAIKQNAHLAHLYPDDNMSELKEKIAQKHKIKTTNIIIGAGSDQIIEFLSHAKLNSKNAYLQCGISFAMYGIYAKHCSAKAYKTTSKTHDLQELKELYKKHKDEIKVVYLCIPNNPLGDCLDKDEVYDFIKFCDKDCVVALDCAYNDFAAFKDSKKKIDAKDLLDNFDNVLFLATFSKLYGLGGLRIGYGIANKELIQSLYKIRAPFNVSNLSLKAAVAALDDEDFVKRTLNTNFNEMKRYEKFAKEFEISYINSYTNFITYIFEKKNTNDLCEKLLKKGIIIRNLQSYGMSAVRITIGKSEDNDRFFDEFSKIYVL